jgi:hypothetical protein
MLKGPYTLTYHEDSSKNWKIYVFGERHDAKVVDSENSVDIGKYIVSQILNQEYAGINIFYELPDDEEFIKKADSLFLNIYNWLGLLEQKYGDYSSDIFTQKRIDTRHQSTDKIDTFGDKVGHPYIKGKIKGEEAGKLFSEGYMDILRKFQNGYNNGDLSKLMKDWIKSRDIIYDSITNSFKSVEILDFYEKKIDELIIYKKVFKGIDMMLNIIDKGELAEDVLLRSLSSYIPQWHDFLSSFGALIMDCYTLSLVFDVKGGKNMILYFGNRHSETYREFLISQGIPAVITVTPGNPDVALLDISGLPDLLFRT